MIGGTVLVLPILALHAGYVNMTVICFIMGMMSYYTAYLIISHVGVSKDIQVSILAHFAHNTTILKMYNVLICLNIAGTSIVYFQLIVMQISGLFGYKDEIPYIVAIVLTFLIIVVRYYNCSE